MGETDDLSTDQVQDLREFGKQVSGYGGSVRSQFYDFASGASPVEAIAEIKSALMMGQLPDRTSSQYESIKKFIIWLKGADFWQNIEEMHSK